MHKNKLKKLRTLKQLGEEIANIAYRCYQHALLWHGFHKTKQNNSVYLCNSTPIIPQ